MACSVCSGGCGNSCQGTCEGYCEGTCEGTCNLLCTSDCAVGCSLECSVGCGEGCTASCTADCADDCSSDCAVGCSENCVSGCVLECAYSASGEGNKVIKLKRTIKQLDDAFVTQSEVVFGEPFYIDSKKYLMIGSSSESKPTNLPVFKAFSQDIIEKQVFFLMVDSTIHRVVLKDQDGGDLYPDTAVESVKVSGDKYLDQKLNEIDNSINSLNQFRSGLKYAGSDTAGGAANSAKKLVVSGAIGGPKKPVYFNAQGVPVAIDNSDIDISITGNSATSSKVDVKATTANTNYYILGATGTGNQDVFRALNTGGSANKNGVYFNGASGVLFGAAWNDFAEFRKCVANPGDCVREVGDGSLVPTSQRLQPGCAVVSDTFGMVIGLNEEGYRPLAVAGRVLVKTDYDRKSFTPGAAVCSGTNGTVSMMTREEIKEYPDRIVGYVSEIPEYDKWNDIEVNGRIWIKIK